MSQEKTAKCINVETKTGQRSGKPYLKVFFSDGSDYNWQTFKQPRFEVGKQYKLLIEPNGQFQNITRADLIPSLPAPEGPSASLDNPLGGSDPALLEVMTANNGLLVEILNKIDTYLKFNGIGV